MASTRETGPHGISDAAGASQASYRGATLRWLPLAAIALALLLFYAFGGHDYLSPATLRRYQGSLDAFISAHAILAAMAYLLAYAAIVAVSFPGAGFLTIAGGFLFGAGLGTALAAIGATVGAVLVFLIARTSLGDFLAKRAGPRAQRLRLGFQKDGFSYLLFLRLVPLFPFWLVNLAAALFGMRLLPYLAATALGILPTTFIFAYFGAGLKTTLEAEQPASLQLFIALLLLGLLALMPLAVRKWRRGREREPGAPGQP
jgi:uncharacterized membrane protein YdjX (TVP38/TMEM64 family)